MDNLSSCRTLQEPCNHRCMGLQQFQVDNDIYKSHESCRILLRDRKDGRHKSRWVCNLWEHRQCNQVGSSIPVYVFQRSTKHFHHRGWPRGKQFCTCIHRTSCHSNSHCWCDTQQVDNQFSHPKDYRGNLFGMCKQLHGCVSDIQHFCRKELDRRRRFDILLDQNCFDCIETCRHSRHRTCSVPLERIYYFDRIGNRDRSNSIYRSVDRVCLCTIVHQYNHGCCGIRLKKLIRQY